jgi:hypothetical protein
LRAPLLCTRSGQVGERVGADHVEPRLGPVGELGRAGLDAGVFGIHDRLDTP